MNKKLVGFIAFALAALSIMGAMVSATSDLQVEYLRIDGEIYDATSVTTDVLEVRRGEELPIRIRLLALNDVEDVQISAGIYGYDYSEYEPEKVFDITDSFDLDSGRTTTKDLELEVPVLADTGDYQLRIFVADRNGQAYTTSYSLDVEGTEDEDAVRIKEAYLTPSNSVLAGRALSALVKVENIGQDDLDSVTLIVSVPELNIRDTETLDELDADESETFEKIILRFPRDTPTGDYLVEYTVKFDEFESVSETDIVSVTNDAEETDNTETQEDKTFITVPNTQTVAADGSGAVYPVMISNLGQNARSYTLNVQGVDVWGTARVDPSSTVIVPAGASTTAFVYVTPNANTQPGDKFFKLTVVSEDEVQDIPLSAVVIGNTNTNNASSDNYDGLKRTLEVGLIILVIILILIGLIVGFNKLRGSDNDGDDKTYY